MLAAMAEQLDNPDVNSAVIAMTSFAGDQKWSWPARNAYKPIKGQLAKPGKPWRLLLEQFYVCAL